MSCILLYVFHIFSRNGTAPSSYFAGSSVYYYGYNNVTLEDGMNGDVVSFGVAGMVYGNGNGNGNFPHFYLQDKFESWAFRVELDWRWCWS